MKLTDLNPRWFAEEGRHGQGVTFDCPHCRTVRLGIAFSPTLDGGPPIGMPNTPEIGTLFKALWPADHVGTNIVPPGIVWQRSGDTFDVLTLAPSVDASASGHWHGFVQGGEIR